MILAEYICYSREHNSAIMIKMKILFPNPHVQCMSELWCKFQMPASNTVGGVVETQTVVRCDMVKICLLFNGYNSVKSSQRAIKLRALVKLRAIRIRLFRLLPLK